MMWQVLQKKLEMKQTRDAEINIYIYIKRLPKRRSRQTLLMCLLFMVTMMMMCIVQKDARSDWHDWRPTDIRRPMYIAF